MAKPLDPKEIVTVQELAISNMPQIEAFRELLLEKGIIKEDEFIAMYMYKKRNREVA
ncbi:MAG: hypothetical protein KAJ09_14510 [Deltaproteobacteria bacterium]|nr:hypothetical protein [Deltaproteobacteria bacterium]